MKACYHLPPTLTSSEAVLRKFVSLCSLGGCYFFGLRRERPEGFRLFSFPWILLPSLRGLKVGLSSNGHHFISADLFTVDFLFFQLALLQDTILFPRTDPLKKSGKEAKIQF